MTHTYYTRGTCSTVITFDLDGEIVSNVKFTGGCNGNLKAISKVVDGMSVDRIEGYFRGIDCRGRGTSCSDQLARAVREAYNEEQSA